MYMITTEEFIDASEPQLGKLTETELIYDIGEIKHTVIEYIEANDEIPKVLTFLDDYTQEEIEINVSEYM